MSARQWLCCLAVVVAGAGVACTDSTAPVVPPQKKANLVAPVHGSFSRYILISGVQVCVEDCDEDRNQKAATGATGMDSVAIRALPQSALPEAN